MPESDGLRGTGAEVLPGMLEGIMTTCDNCSKRWSHRCEVWQAEKRYPPDDDWCKGWKKGKLDANLALIDTLVDSINKQTEKIGRMKICSTCKKPRPLKDGYYRDQRASDGLMSSCKECQKKAVRPHLNATRREEVDEYGHELKWLPCLGLDCEKVLWTTKYNRLCDSCTGAAERRSSAMNL